MPAATTGAMMGMSQMAVIFCMETRGEVMLSLWVSGMCPKGAQKSIRQDLGRQRERGRNSGNHHNLHYEWHEETRPKREHCVDPP